jgi:hypothetical protein
VIVAAALLPHPPLLLRELDGLHDSVPELRRTAREAVQDVLHDVDRVVVVGAADRKGPDWSMGWPAEVHGFGPSSSSTGAAVPLSLGVGLRVLEEAGWSGPVGQLALGWDESDGDIDEIAGELATGPEPTALVVLGDGSARRGERAPGYLDDRAFAFDDALAVALAEGDARSLRHLDVELAADLMVFGRTAFRLLGAVALRQGGPEQARLLLREDPFGVSYFVATWMFGDTHR